MMRRDQQVEATKGKEARVRQVVLRRGDASPSLRDAPWPRREGDQVLARTLLTSVDGTDREVLDNPGAAWPEGEAFVVLGHECLGEVLESPAGSSLEPGQRVVPLVRHGCGHCDPCLAGNADLCETGDYTEHGIKGLHGFMRDAWTDTPDSLVPVPADLGRLAVLTEPLSVIVKALDVARLVQRRIPTWEEAGGFAGQRALITGAGNLGTLAAFLLRDEGMDVWTYDRAQPHEATPRLLRAIGATTLQAGEEDLEEVARDVGGFDLVIEATGAPKVLFQALPTLADNGVMCMLGVPAERPAFPVDGDVVMRRMVMRNQVLLGSVNSRREHFDHALRRLRSFRRRFDAAPDRILTHILEPAEFEEAFADGPDVIKKVIRWSEEG